MKLIIDATNLFRWQGPPTGIVRVEMELARYCLSNLNNLQYIFVCCSGFPHVLPNDKVRDVIKKIESKGHSFAWSFFISKVKSSIKKVVSFAVPDSLRTSLKKALAGYIEVQEGDVFVGVKTCWSKDEYQFFSYLKERKGVKLVSIVHDMIPLTHPEYFAGLNESKVFFDYFYHLNYLFDRLAFVSNFSGSEFKKLVKEHGMSSLPVLKTIYLGNDVKNNDLPLEKIKRKPYVLYVSTIEVRKNHISLLKAWLRAEECSIDMPDLICVGRKGWLAEEVWHLYQSNPSLSKKVTFLSDIYDDMLVELYKHCLFTVYPSRVEGYGLGVAESLAYGKICIISTAAALNEAAQGIMPMVEPDNIDGWIKKISSLFSDTIERKRIESKIKNEFVPRSWETFAKEFVSFAMGQA